MSKDRMKIPNISRGLKRIFSRSRIEDLERIAKLERELRDMHTNLLDQMELNSLVRGTRDSAIDLNNQLRAYHDKLMEENAQLRAEINNGGSGMVGRKFTVTNVLEDGDTIEFEPYTDDHATTPAKTIVAKVEPSE